MTKNNVANLVSVNYGQLWGFFHGEFPAYNPGRDDVGSWGSPTTQIPLGLSKGYDISKGSLIVVDVETAKRIFAELAENETDESLKALYAEIAADPVKVAMAQRAERAAKLRENGDKATKYVVSNPSKPDEDIAIEVTNRHVADVLDSFAKTKPTYFVMCGQRRFFAGGHTLALAEIRSETKPADFEWFASVKDFDSVSDLHDTVLQENQQNERQGYSLVGLTRNAIKLLDEHPRMGETDLGRLLGMADQISPETGKVTKSYRGARQQLYRLAKLALARPDLDIARRVGLPETKYADSHATKAGKQKYVKGDYIPVAKLNKEDIACLLGIRKEPTDICKVLIPAYEQGTIADSATFEKYVKAVMDGERPKGSLTAKDLKAYVDVERIASFKATVKDVLTAILDGDSEWFDKLGK